MASEVGGGAPPWPALGWEERSWHSGLVPELMPTAMHRAHQGPYYAAVVPRIGALTPSLPSEVTALAEAASIEIARFDTELGSEVAPFASVLLRSESASSSRIENLTSGARAIALAELGARDQGNALEVVGNVAAMRAALALSERLDEEAILAMHAALMTGHSPEMAGRLRREQVWLGGDDFGPHGADFVPPAHEHVPGLLEDLVAFLRRDDIPALVQAAIAHAQFETIHPFPDGNGRTGRALMQAMVRGRGLTRNVTVPVSAGLLTDTRGYFDTLTRYREGDPAAIVAKVAQACFSAVTNGRRLVGDLRWIRQGWETRIRARRGAGAWRLAEVVLRRPVIDAAGVAEELGITAQNAQRAIAPLVEAGVLVEFTGFARNRMWQATQVLDALDEFAARAGRRAW